ncbi:MAG: DUF4113 domain-containing protein [Planctomycetes bacterium]|nr:DUF4113 domain-containing protein [Planctomycetota bacterium]
MQQGNLFFQPGNREKQIALMQVVDKMNRNLGDRAIFYASQGTGGDRRMRRDMMSPRYTTRWEQLPRAR